MLGVLGSWITLNYNWVPRSVHEKDLQILTTADATMKQELKKDISSVQREGAYARALDKLFYWQRVENSILQSIANERNAERRRQLHKDLDNARKEKTRAQSLVDRYQ